jgi:hypothetical protein
MDAEANSRSRTKTEVEMLSSRPWLELSFLQFGRVCTPKHTAIVKNKCFTFDIMTVRFVVQVLIASSCASEILANKPQCRTQNTHALLLKDL